MNQRVRKQANRRNEVNEMHLLDVYVRLGGK